MKSFSILSAVFGLASITAAHMEMKDPPPFRSKFNEFTTDQDYSMTSPLDQSGSNFPCKGYHSLVGTPQGQSVATWQPGQSYSMTITGGASHNGGSCQASLSYDGGASWTVIHSYIGNCPVSGDSSYDFAVPADAPGGEALFAWTWFNQSGNREMYMNCAAVTIGGSSSKVKRQDSGFSSRPSMFAANVGNGCATTEGTDVEFPNPGPDVTNNSQKTGPPTGSCGGGEQPNPPVEDPPVENPPVESTPVQSTPVQTSQVPAPTASVPGGIFISVTDTPTPSTLQTVTRSAEQPAPTDGGSETPEEGAFTPGEACQSEGEWNCVSGSKFQRCASGQWSALIDVYPGTTCSAGQSKNYVVQRRDFNLGSAIRSYFQRR